MNAVAASPPRYRAITRADIPALFFVRTRTRENSYTAEQLQRLGITPHSVEAKVPTSCKGWLCTIDDQVVGFCMADRASVELWVLAIHAQVEGRGIGKRLMSLAEQWLWASGCRRAWLTTDLDTTRRAYGFFRLRGWTDWKVDEGLRWMALLPPQAVGD